MKNLMNNPRWLSLLLFVIAHAAPVFAQETEDGNSSDKPNLLVNGSFEEEASEKMSPEAWNGGTRVTDEAVEGKAALLLDTRNNDLSKLPFTAVNQAINPKDLQGKKVRFSASVKTADRTGGGQAMLWLRVDRKDKRGRPLIAAFDNMQDRPITSDEWGRYEIVLEVAEDAQTIIGGLIVQGKARAWMDDARLEVVDKKVPTTGRGMGGGGADLDSPPTPFYSHWIWLAGFAIALMFVSQMSNRFIQRFALRFTFTYWLLYIFLTTILGMMFSILGIVSTLRGSSNQPINIRFVSAISNGYEQGTRTVIDWVASKFLQIQVPPRVPTGSGDTTSEWVRVFTCFLIALIVSVIWTALWRSDKDSGRLRDMLRIGLRYSLAITLLGYGLHKAGFISTQFLPAGMSQETRFDQNFGDFSPMGLLWMFMQSSTMYTFFAGLFEVIPAILLVFRRTATFGAVSAIVVMSNVVLLNMCYDVPVKQFSMHLLIMAILILLPDMPRIINLLFWNRATEPSTHFHQPYFQSKTGLSTYGIAKAVIVIAFFAVPVGMHAYQELTHEHSAKPESEYLLLNRGFHWVSEFPFNR